MIAIGTVLFACVTRNTVLQNLGIFASYQTEPFLLSRFQVQIHVSALDQAIHSLAFLANRLIVF